MSLTSIIHSSFNFKLIFLTNIKMLLIFFFVRRWLIFRMRAYRYRQNVHEVNYFAEFQDPPALQNETTEAINLLAASGNSPICYRCTYVTWLFPNSSRKEDLKLRLSRKRLLIDKPLPCNASVNSSCAHPPPPG